MEDTLGAVVAPRQLEEERCEVERLCLSDRRKSSARAARARTWLARWRLLGRYQRCEALIYDRDGRFAGDRSSRGAEGRHPRACKRG